MYTRIPNVLATLALGASLSLILGACDSVSVEPTVPGADAATAMEGHVLATAGLVGTYARPR